EQAAFAASVGSEQAWYAAMSGMQHAMEIAKSRGADPAEWENKPDVFFHQLVVDDGSDKWFFTVFTSAPPEEQSVRYGMTDETRKLNLNKATPEMLTRATFLSPQQIEAITGAGLTNAASMA